RHYGKNARMVNGVSFVFWIVHGRKNLYHVTVFINLKYKISFPFLEMNCLIHLKTYSEDQTLFIPEEGPSLCERNSFVRL
ncbi:MAG: hypothetical protein KGH81_07730, partial [Thaumarchaeota archaeon]|nr:hypothetical protein [Nitrososphaerota archaeon]